MKNCHVLLKFFYLFSLLHIFFAIKIQLKSLFSSDTCPETPDSSVKEEADVNSPDTGSYVCLWQDCHEEFVTQKALVDHITDSHMESKKGCEEFPCLWKVSFSFFQIILKNLRCFHC